MLYSLKKKWSYNIPIHNRHFLQGGKGGININLITKYPIIIILIGGNQSWCHNYLFLTQAAQAHYSKTDVTLASEQCCVTNGYLQRLVWDVNGFS